MSDLRLGVHERITIGSRCRRDEVPIEILALFEVVSELAGAGLCSLGQPGSDPGGQSTNGGTSERRECGDKSDIHSSLFRARTASGCAAACGFSLEAADPMRSPSIANHLR